MNPSDSRDEVNKRLTLNWLIQGAAQHAGMTVQYLVRDELDALNPKLLRLYDRIALFSILQYWRFDAVVLLGWPPRFWRRAATDPRHPFFHHPILARHGATLAASAKERAVARAREKGLSLIPGALLYQVASAMANLATIEPPHSYELVELAKRTTATVWGISPDRLVCELTSKVEFGDLSRPRTLRGRILRNFAVGYGGVMHHDGRLAVVAKGANWFLLAKELVKGTAELICLHGLNSLGDETYRHVMHEADQLEYEPWMLQSGGELWRRLLAVLPEGRPLAEMLMHLARLPARSLERLVLAVLEQPDWARELLAGIGAADPDPATDWSD